MTKRTKWLLATAGVAVVIAFSIYLFTRENPAYINAAKGLEQAKKNAVRSFGTLTWEEYRAERGIETRDDSDAWEEIKRTVPVVVYNYSYPDPGDTGLKAAFLADRSWFVTIGDRIDGLTIQHVYDPKYKQWSRRSSITNYSVHRALQNGVIGAADAGDIEAVRRITQAEWSLIEKERSETDWSSYLITEAMISVFERALLVAVVRNRNNPDVLDEIRNGLQNWPRMPSLADSFAGDVRSESHTLDELRGLEPWEIDQWLDDRLLHIQELLSIWKRRTPSEQLESDFGFAKTRVRNVFRGTGPHTLDALNARYWEMAVEFHDAMDGFEQDRSKSRKQVFAAGAIMFDKNDVSYELAKMVLGLNFYVATSQLSVHRVFWRESGPRRVAVEMIWRFPEYESLPDELPQDLLFADSYGGGDVLYRKTSAGFVIYSRGENKIDDGFVETEPGLFRESDVRTISIGKDYGLVVCYDPIVPVP